MGESASQFCESDETVWLVSSKYYTGSRFLTVHTELMGNAYLGRTPPSPDLQRKDGYTFGPNGISIEWSIARQ